MNSQLREGKWILIIFLCWLFTPGFVNTQDSSQNFHRTQKISIEAYPGNPSFQKFKTNLIKNNKLVLALKTDESQPDADTALTSQHNLSYLNHSDAQNRSLQKIPPRIIHIPVASQNVHQEFLIIAKILDDKPHLDVHLHYRKGGEKEFAPEPMLRLRSFFQAKIPANLVTPDGIEYFIKVIDADSLVSRIPTNNSFFIAVHVPEPGLAYQLIHRQNDSLSNWRLFSFPLKLEQNKLKRIFLQSNQIGKRASTEKTNAIQPRDNSELILPGQAFWRTVSDTPKVIFSGPAASIPTNSDFLIPLETGWNFIGNPFTFPVAIQQLYRQSAQPIQLRTFHGRWNHPLQEPVRVLEPFVGYAIFNHAPYQDSLFINPKHATETILAHKHEPLQKHSIPWMIQILAQSKKSKDIDNVIGHSDQSYAEWDPFDEPEPPTIRDNVALFLHRPEWKNSCTRFCADFRPVKADGDVWEFHLQTRDREAVTLDFKGIDGLPGQFDIWLLDDSLNISRDLRLFPEYIVTDVDSQTTRTFKLIIGKKDFIAEKLDETVTIPGKFQLAQNYPNPFNPETNIQYSLAAPGVVTLKIFNLVGEEVLTLVDDQFQTAGYYIVTWNGQNEFGLKMTSGIYVYQLWVNNFTLARKMVLMK
jgi:hypothetical protein